MSGIQLPDPGTQQAPMHLVSLFDGIGGFPEAFRRAGVRTVATCEIDKAAAGVAADHFPEAVHFDDVTELKTDDLIAAGFDPVRGVLTAGWPCTDLSLAGLRLGLGGARSGLVGEVFRLVLGLQPRWFVLENVPGLLSSVCPCPGGGACDSGACAAGSHVVQGGACGRRVRRGRATGPGRCMALHGGGMGTVLRSLVECGYGLAYRILDAQHFGVPQRRRRVVIVGCLGDWAAPAQVLLEPEGRSGHPSPGEQAEAGTARRTGRSAGDGVVAGTLMARGPDRRIGPDEAAGHHLQIVNALTMNMAGGGGGADDNTAQGGHLVATTLTAREGKGPDSDATTTLVYAGAGTNVGPMGTLRAGSGSVAGGVPFTLSGQVTHALTAEGADASAPDAVRRLTPVECERLQGFPDGWTATSYGRPQSDSARYRQLGNSIAVPVFAWVARRIVAAEEGS